MTRQRVRIAEGVYRDRYGLAATVKVGRIQREHRFGPDESLEVIKRWRLRIRRDLEDTLAEATRQNALPAENLKRLTPSADGWCYVYFVRAGDRVKIGRATDPCQRFRSLQTATAEPLSFVLSIATHASLESAIQNRFEHLRLRGEWFRLEPDLVAFIQAIQQGANPIELLW
jgi:hypothetical protein